MPKYQIKRSWVDEVEMEDVVVVDAANEEDAEELACSNLAHGDNATVVETTRATAPSVVDIECIDNEEETEVYVDVRNNLPRKMPDFL